MNDLRELQRAVQHSVLQHDVRPALPIIARTEGAPARDRLNVYIHAYGARLTDLLRNDFNGLLAMVGESTFDDLARAYIDAHLSREFNVRWYGADFAQFLVSTLPWSETPAIGEMAKLDWAIGLCFDAPDESCVTASDLEAQSPDRWAEMRFHIRRSVQRLRFRCNVGEVRRASDRGDPIPQLVRNPVERGWIVSRVDTKIFHRGVADDEDVALATIAGGGSFAEVCEALCQWHEDDAVAMRAVVLLRGWIDSGWLAELVVPIGGPSPDRDG